MLQKKVSIIIPVYNSELYLHDALMSIVNQSYKNLEIIIINDGSTDNSLNIINSIKDERIIIRTTKNQGIIKALNLGLSLSSGEYIARMDSDDISFLTRIEKQVDFLNNNSSIFLCGTQVEFFDGTSGYSDLPLDDDNCRINLLFSVPVYHPTVMFRNVGLLYDMNYKDAEDYKYWFDISSYGDISNLNEVLLKYRIHEKQLSRQYNTNQVCSQIKVSKLALSKYLNKYENNYIELVSCYIDELISNNRNDFLIKNHLYYILAFFGMKGFILYIRYIYNCGFNRPKIFKFILRTIKWRNVKLC